MTIYVPPQPKASPHVDYYHKVIAPSISGYFDSEFWSSLVLQLSQDEDAVRHAVAAICATHQAKESVALEESNAAIRCLSTKIRTNTTTAIVPLVACVLFSCREFMGGSVDSALLHVFSGLRILNQTTRNGDGIVDKLIAPIYSRLNILCVLFGHALPAVHSNNQEIITGSFRSLDDARHQLIEIMDRSLRFIRMASAKLEVADVEFEDWINQAKLLSELRAWQVNLDEIAATSEHGPSEYQLRMHNRTVFIWLSVCLSAEECAVDAHIDGFKEIVELGSRLALATRSSDIFSFEMRIIPPLYYTALKCRDPSVRRQALNLLASTSPREGLWDARIAMKVAERAMQIEENELGSSLLPSESSRIYAVTELPAEFRPAPFRRATSSVPGIIEVEFITRPWGVNGERNVLRERVLL
jgi:hypothetical protein